MMSHVVCGGARDDQLEIELLNGTVSQDEEEHIMPAGEVKSMEVGDG